MTLQRLFRGLVFVLAAALSISANAQQKQPEYQLGKGDTIHITVFQNPDLTVDTRVTENDTITYPLVGTLKIGGMTISAAQQVIAKALSDGNYIQKPQVNIVLVQNHGNQVSVLGMVGKPGRYPLETFDIRVSEMIALAGGMTSGSADVAILTGIRDGKQIRKVIDIPGMFIYNNFADDIVVAGGDEIYVHRQPMYYIYGEVQKPGSSRVERNMTVRQALAQSGGPTTRGTERRLRIYRRGADGKVESLSPNLDDPVQPDDVLYVSESIF